MPFVLVWKPVMRPLQLGEYHPDFEHETIMVCVNPSPETVKRRDELMEQNAIRFTRTVEPGESRKKKQQIADTRQKVDEYIQWKESTFDVQMDEWFAALWSFGVDKYSAEDIRQYRAVDPHFVNWLFVRSIEMIKEHNTGKKKN